jgi:ATP-dependent protease ClpP protease subunit
MNIYEQNCTSLRSLTQLGPGFEQGSGRIEFQPRNEHISASFAVPVTHDGIYALCSRLDEAVDYYKYDRIELSLHSPGGSAAALKYFMACRDRWTKTGIELHTIALNEACSAAAFMLSIGTLGSRSVQAHTNLIYHFARLSAGEVFERMNRQSEGQLTARGSRKAATSLRAIERMIAREDEFLMEHLFEHIFDHKTASGEDWAISELPRRISHVSTWLAFKTNNERRIRSMTGDFSMSELKKTLARLNGIDLTNPNWVMRVQDEIRRLFDRDEASHPVLGYLLLLIDRVEGLEGFSKYNGMTFMEKTK